jgi:hypothetical protein
LELARVPIHSYNVGMDDNGMMNNKIENMNDGFIILKV